MASPVSFEKSAAGIGKNESSAGGGGAGFRYRLLPLTAERNNRDHRRNFTNTSTFRMSESAENDGQMHATTKQSLARMSKESPRIFSSTQN